VKSIITLLCIFGSFSSYYCQTNFSLFPAGLNIQPFTANFLEPRTGFQMQLNNNELRLDIGNSVDIMKWQKENSTYSFGADFFTYTLLRGEKDFHFPVDAIDYLFGLNAGYRTNIEDVDYGFRLRLSHISAHFVDGHFDNQKQMWRDSLNPQVYSREFLELISYILLSDIRVYAGYTYIYHIDPLSIGKHNYQVGFDYFAGDLFPGKIIPFAGYDLRITQVDGTNLNHTFTMGLKIGYARSKGISILYNYVSGKSIHGEYYFMDKNYSALGFNLDL